MGITSSEVVVSDASPSLVSVTLVLSLGHHKIYHAICAYSNFVFTR